MVAISFMFTAAMAIASYWLMINPQYAGSAYMPI